MLDRTNQLERTLPLCDPEAEMRVLGSLLCSDSQDIAYQISDGLSAEAFSVSKHELIYRQALKIIDRGDIPTINRVVDELKLSNELELIGGKIAISNIIDAGMFVPDLAYDLARLKDFWLRRAASSLSEGLWVKVSNEAISARMAIEGAAEQLGGLVAGTNDRFELKTALEVAITALDSDHDPTVSTGFLDLDTLTGGISPGQLAVVAAATGLGKTHYLIAQALGVARHGPVLLFSLEMTEQEVLARLLANLAKVDSWKIYNKKLNDEESNRVVAALDNPLLQNICIYDNPNPSFAEIKAQIRKVAFKTGHPPVMVCLDYLQLMGGSDPSNRTRELDVITRQCKQIAVNHNLHFLAASQINRAVASRNDKRPTLADLRESGAIENHANRVILLYRDDYYDAESCDRGLIEIHIPKNRGGKTGKVKMIFQAEYSLFLDLAPRLNG